MAADLHIHIILDPCTEEHVKVFSSHTLGSSYFGYKHPILKNDSQDDSPDSVWQVVMNTPDIWIGEVSWLKAALFEDGDTFIPNPVGKIAELVGWNFPTLTPDLIEQIVAALSLENITQYSIANSKTVRDFLTQYMDKRIFQVSW